MRALLAAGMVVATFGLAVAKLPAPPPMDDKAKAATEEKKAKDAAAAELVKQQQAKAEERVAAPYIAVQKAKGTNVTRQLAPTSTTNRVPLGVADTWTTVGGGGADVFVLADVGGRVANRVGVGWVGPAWVVAAIAVTVRAAAV